MTANTALAQRRAVKTTPGYVMVVSEIKITTNKKHKWRFCRIAVPVLYPHGIPCGKTCEIFHGVSMAFDGHSIVFHVLPRVA